MLDISVWCDICREQVKSQGLNEFACDLTVFEVKTSLTGTDLHTQKERIKEIKQICKGCYYKFFNKLFNEKNKEKNN